MDDTPPPATDESTQIDPAVADAINFFSALFDERDLVLFRPVESWTEGGRKRSGVDFRNVCYHPATPASVCFTLTHLLKVSAKERTNLFFGICPRVGSKGQFDLAPQIRVVRALWTDIDHISVEEALAQIGKAQLPRPTVLVNSGNGVHCYWRLDQPYLIDDSGDPPRVLTEWTEAPGGRKKPRKYVVESGDKLYLDQHKHLLRLSPKAEHLQNILAGVAQAVGGDHTTDLARLLRIPGTLNRKDEKNGKEPVPCVLVECEPTRRYSLATFERLAVVSPESERAKKIAAMPLPSPRRLTAAKGDKLNELIAASAIAPAGARSEADFAVCCYAVRSGIAKEDAWRQVENVGKFAEQGQRYFDHTWGNAEHEVRASTFEKLQKRNSPKHPEVSAPIQGDSDDGDSGAPPEAAEPSDSERPTIIVDAANTHVAVTMAQITDRMLQAGNCFNRAEQLVAIYGESISPILKPIELAGFLNQHVEFYFVDEEAGEYKPLPTQYGGTWLNQPSERARLPIIKLFSHNPVYTDDWRLVPPGFDAESGIYYAGAAVEPRKGTEHLDLLLRDFCFKHPADRTNYIGVLLTALLVPRFIGSKPAVLFNGNQPELGKSILAQIIAILRDGGVAETATYNPNDEEFEKRLGSIVRRGSTTIIIDNAKARGRNPRIESACLERSITDPILSFRLLGYSQDIRAENSHIFCITANSPDVSRDLVTRSVVINLYYEGDPERRTYSIQDPEGYAREHRAELLGELLGMVERWKAAGMPLANVHSRFNKRGWGNIIGGILHVNGEPDFLANAGEAAESLDETRRDFVELIAVMADHCQGTWAPKELAELCERHGLLKEELGEGSARSQSTRLGVLAGRYVAERFELSDGRQVVFHKAADRKGSTYHVEICDEVPNVGASAERLPNVENYERSAP